MKGTSWGYWRKTVALDRDIRPALDSAVARYQKHSEKHITKSRIVNDLIRKSNLKNLDSYSSLHQKGKRDRLTLDIDFDNFKKINDQTALLIEQAAKSGIKVPSPNFSRTLNSILRKELGL